MNPCHSVTTAHNMTIIQKSGFEGYTDDIDDESSNLAGFSYNRRIEEYKTSRVLSRLCVG